MLLTPSMTSLELLKLALRCSAASRLENSSMRSVNMVGSAMRKPYMDCFTSPTIKRLSGRARAEKRAFCRGLQS